MRRAPWVFIIVSSFLITHSPLVAAYRHGHELIGAASPRVVAVEAVPRALASSRSSVQMTISGKRGGSGGDSLSARVRMQLAKLVRIGRWMPGNPSQGPSKDGAAFIGGAGSGNRDSTLHLSLAVAPVLAPGTPRPEGNRKKRVLFLISDTGGGHRASAQALEAALHELYPNSLSIEIVDIWTTFGPRPFNTCVKGYQYLAKRPALWRLIWYFSVFPPTNRFTKEWAKASGTPGLFQQCLEQHSPDLVVSVHPLTQNIPLQALAKMGGGVRRIPFVTVVTDLGSAHPDWFHTRVDRCFVPSDELHAKARERGLTEAQIRQFGLPIRPTFWQTPRPKASTRRALGLKAELPTVLVVGGGDGVGSLEAIVRSIANSARALRGERDDERVMQLMVVCGRNEALRAQLESAQWPAHVRVVVYGFVSQMSDLMAAADVLVSKAGPGTIAEAAARGLPVVLSSFLPGQEAGNARYVEKAGFGVLSRRPPAIGRVVMRWLLDPPKLAELAAAAKSAARPSATYHIADEIGSLLFGHRSSLMSPALSLPKLELELA